MLIANKRQLLNVENEGIIMRKKVFVFLLCCLCAANNNYARFLNQQNVRSFIVVLKEPSLSRCAFDEQGNCLYKGISTRENRHVEHVIKRRLELEDKLSRFENRLRRISPDIIPRRRFTGLLNGLNGVSTAVTQKLLEHSSPDLTNKIYEC
jgi:hypothetical protein